MEKQSSRETWREIDANTSTGTGGKATQEWQQCHQTEEGVLIVVPLSVQGTVIDVSEVHQARSPFFPSLASNLPLSLSLQRIQELEEELAQMRHEKAELKIQAAVAAADFTRRESALLSETLTLRKHVRMMCVASLSLPFLTLSPSRFGMQRQSYHSWRRKYPSSSERWWPPLCDTKHGKRNWR
jgi:hypothetical protein